jgi:hypothetical protein
LDRAIAGTLSDSLTHDVTTAISAARINGRTPGVVTGAIFARSKSSGIAPPSSIVRRELSST